MKKWKIILAAVLAVLVLVVTPLAIFAQNDTSSNPQSKIREFKGGLALVAPRAVLTGNQMQLTVFLRANQEPVSDVNIWLVSKEDVEILKNELNTLRNNAAVNKGDKNYEDVIKVYATFLDKTEEKGRLTWTFDRAGDYALVAFKKGYWPDVSGLAVRTLPKALVVSAPRKAKVDNTVNISVKLKGTNLPAIDAGVWAISAENLEAARAQAQSFKAANEADKANADWEKELDLIAKKLGRTDDHGNLAAQFDNKGIYLLVAFQKGHIPGFSGIMIVETLPTVTSPAVTDARK
jgi:hypothetical protein